MKLISKQYNNHTPIRLQFLRKADKSSSFSPYLCTCLVDPSLFRSFYYIKITHSYTMTKSITYQGHKVYYNVDGQGEVVLFVHGWPTNSKLWSAQVDAFKQSFKVITFDWLGFGKSDKPKDYHYTFTRKKEILDVLIKALVENNERVTIIAHDIGGPPTILWTFENQARVKRLILLNTLTSAYATWFERISHPLFVLPITKEILVSDFGLKRFLNTFTVSSSKSTKEHIENIVLHHQDMDRSTRLRTVLEPLKEGRANELLSINTKLEQLAVDKYLIIAKKDPLLYEHMRRFKDKHSDTPSFLLPKCSHFIPVDQPKQLNEILLTILTPGN